MALESVTIAIAAFLLSLSGVSAIAAGDYLYVVNAHRAVLVQIGVMDWMAFLLLDFFYVFAIWTYVTVKGGQFRSRSYLALGAMAFPMIFLGNALKIFAQVFVSATAGTLAASHDAATAASMDALGFGVMLGTVFILLAGTCLFLTRAMPGQFGWLVASNWPEKKIP